MTLFIEKGRRMNQFDYYYGNESEQFAFIMVPRLLITGEQFSGLSCESKILYGLLLARMSLSRKNGWFDENHRVYIIYPIQQIEEDLHISHATAVKALKELDTKSGIGLVEKKVLGQGRDNRLYVKNFISEKEENKPGVPIKRRSAPRSLSIKLQEVQNLNSLESDFYTSGNMDLKLQEVQNLNFPLNSYKEPSDTESIDLSPESEEDWWIGICRFRLENGVLPYGEILLSETRKEYFVKRLLAESNGNYCDDLRQCIFENLNRALIEMLDIEHPTTINGRPVTAGKILEYVSLRLDASDNPPQIDLREMIEAAVENYARAAKTRSIKHPQQYLKSCIFNTLVTGNLDVETATAGFSY